MQMHRVVGCALALVCGLAAAAPNPKVAEARRLIDDLEMDEALKALDEAASTAGNAVSTVVEISALKGQILGTLGKTAAARDAFKKALMLNPDYRLPNDQPPKVRTPYYEARDWAERNGRLLLEAADVPGDLGTTAVAVVVKHDGLKSTRTVAFHLEVDGQWTVVRVTPGETQRAQTPVKGAGVRWWAEALGEWDDGLASLGSADAPLVAGAPRAATAPVAAATPAAPALAEQPAASGGWKRPVGIVLLGLGVAAVAGGGYFGWDSQSAREQVRAASGGGTIITTLTQREAFALDARARSSAVTANVLFGAGAALAASGIVLFILSGSDAQPTVLVAPTANGLQLAGQF